MNSVGVIIRIKSHNGATEKIGNYGLAIAFTITRKASRPNYAGVFTSKKT